MAGKDNLIFRTEWFDCFQAAMFGNKHEGKDGKVQLVKNLCIYKKYYDRKSQRVKYSKVNCNKNEFAWLKMCIADADKRAKKQW